MLQPSSSELLRESEVIKLAYLQQFMTLCDEDTFSAVLLQHSNWFMPVFWRNVYFLGFTESHDGYKLE